MVAPADSQEDRFDYSLPREIFRRILMNSITDALDALCRIDGVSYASLVDADGCLIEYSGEDHAHFIEPGSFITALKILCQQIESEYPSEAMAQSYLEFDDFNFTCVPIAEYFLCVIASTSANLGRVRLEIKKNRKFLETFVS